LVLIHTFFTNSKEDSQRKFIMTATKPTTSTPASSVSKKTSKTVKKAGSAEFSGAAAAVEYNSIDTQLQGMNTQRRYARRGSKTPGMLSASASRFVFDSQPCFAFGRNKLESGVSGTTLLNALRLKMQKDSQKYLDYGAH
jgi:hypothetical protein